MALFGKITAEDVTLGTVATAISAFSGLVSIYLIIERGGK